MAPLGATCGVNITCVSVREQDVKAENGKHEHATFNASDNNAFSRTAKYSAKQQPAGKNSISRASQYSRPKRLPVVREEFVPCGGIKCMLEETTTGRCGLCQEVTVKIPARAQRRRHHPAQDAYKARKKPLRLGPVSPGHAATF